MAALDSTQPEVPEMPEVPEVPDVPHGGVPGNGSAALRGAAVTLWVVVGGALGYGILQTAMKASALFGG